MTYKLAQAVDGTYYLILVDDHGIEHPQETLIEQEFLGDRETGNFLPGVLHETPPYGLTVREE